LEVGSSNIFDTAASVNQMVYKFYLCQRENC